MINMAKRKGKSGNGEAQYSITQGNLDRKGKTNKKLKTNPMASKYLTPRGKELKEAAATFAKEHPAKSGRRYKRNLQKVQDLVSAAS
jgi:hypothetical protein